MKKSFYNGKIKSLFPYFLLGFALILTHRIIGASEVFLSFASWTWGIIAPFFFGFLIAYIVNIPLGGIQKLLKKTQNKFIIKRRRLFSVLIFLVIVLGITALFLSFVIPAIARSISFFIENIPTYIDAITGFVEDFNNLGLFGININPTWLVNMAGNFFGNFSPQVLESPINAIMAIPGAIFTVAIALISSIYVLVEKSRIKKLFRRLFKVFASDKVSETFFEIVKGLNKSFRQYVRTQSIDGLILAVMVTIALAIMGSPYALLFGLMLGILNFIPYFGSIFGTIIAVLVVLLTQGLTMGIISAVALFAIQQVESNIIQPRLMSSSFSLSPLLIIISITIGGAIAGIMGMIVAIPIIAVLKDLFDRILDYYEHKNNVADDAGEGAETVVDSQGGKE